MSLERKQALRQNGALPYSGRRGRIWRVRKATRKHYCFV